MRRVTVLSTLALATAACAHTASVPGSRPLEISETEYRLTPQDIRVRAGELSILVRNHGRLTHNLVLSSSGHSVIVSPPIPPGQSEWVFAFLTPGRYLMASTLLSDQALGLYGTLVVAR